MKSVHFWIDKTSVNKPVEFYVTTKTAQNCFVFQFDSKTLCYKPTNTKNVWLQYTVVEMMYNLS